MGIPGSTDTNYTFVKSLLTTNRRSDIDLPHACHAVVAYVHIHTDHAYSH